MSSESLLERPILNSPYGYPVERWELDHSGQPTNPVIPRRRPAQYVSPIPQAKKRRAEQQDLDASSSELSTERRTYDLTPVINALSRRVDAWQALQKADDWGGDPETARPSRREADSLGGNEGALGNSHLGAIILPQRELKFREFCGRALNLERHNLAFARRFASSWMAAVGDGSVRG